ncbi:MAG: hypothetical protein KGL39_50895, partial [Patescibacteria group bacterium]|nr:hypothetical protein [Patescibacteria group bacterium]
MMRDCPDAIGTFASVFQSNHKNPKSRFAIMPPSIKQMEDDMERSVAIKALGKLLGKGFGYRVNDRAPTREDR